jgi:hypothetical protein
MVYFSPSGDVPLIYPFEEHFLQLLFEKAAAMSGLKLVVYFISFILLTSNTLSELAAIKKLVGVDH